MGREYSKKRSTRAHSSAPQQILVMVVCFLLGYFTATVFDIEAISRWLNSQVLAHHEASKESPKPKTGRQAVNPPKPKFEFYTLLTNEKAKTSNSQQSTANTAVATARPTPTTTATSTVTAVQTAAVTIAATAPGAKPAVSNKAQSPTMARVVDARPPVVPTAGSRGTYSVQVAAFKTRNDAEHMKGLLTLKGFNVSVIPINHVSKGTWYRVVVGPYSNRSLAQRAQMDLARNSRLHGMVTAG